MNPFEMVVLIVAIVCFANVARSRNRARAGRDAAGAGLPAETAHLQGEVRQLKERIAVLERIVTDADHNRGLALEHEIEALRDARRERREEMR